MSNDKVQIGLTAENNEFMEEFGKHFQTQAEAAKFAMSFAINRNVAFGSTAGDTKWHTRTFDPDGDIASVVQTLYPGTVTPYRLIEHLANQGLTLLKKESEARGGLEPSDLLDLMSLSNSPAPGS